MISPLLLPEPHSQGQALAALSQLGKLEIFSRAAGTFETYSKVVRAGRELQCGPSAVPRRQRGTTVCVSEFGFTQPVRRRAMLQEAASGALAERLKGRLAALMLPWPEVELVVVGGGGGGGRRRVFERTPVTILHFEQVRFWYGHRRICIRSNKTQCQPPLMVLTKHSH
jgi:hypothetical protein